MLRRALAGTAILPLLLAACAGGSSDSTAATDTGSESASSGASASGTHTTDTGESTTDASTTSASTTSSSSSSSSSSTSTTGLLDHCPSVASPVVQATIADPEISEASGLAQSRSQPGVFWVHNDSGDSARFFAFDGAGATLGIFALTDVDAEDWEDLALGPGPTPGAWIYLADIGDNLAARPRVTVYRVPEPDAAAARGGLMKITGAEAIVLAYPDKPHDAETLLVDPATGDLFIAIKSDPTRIFRHPGPVTAGGPYVLEEVTPIVAPGTYATGGDVSPAGDFVAIRTYTQAHLWLRPKGGDLRDAFATAPCVLPLAAEVQGETLAIAGDASGYYTLSEMASQPLWWYAFQ
ncbi:MAG: hypothetical protein R3B09_17865 [Nannocystaceae bacterium]